MNELTLSDIENDTLDFLIGMPMEDKHAYFHKLIETFYPKCLNNEDEYEALLENYVSLLVLLYCMYGIAIKISVFVIDFALK